MLEIEELTCGYNTGFFLRDINLKIRKEEIVGVIGPNGSGKTTLLKVITRALKPTKGRIILNGKNLWQIPIRELFKKIAIVSQDTNIRSIVTEDYVLLGRIPHFNSFQLIETKKDFEIAERSMFLTDTLRLRRKFIDKISGGERQLVFIARALAQEPELLLLDEPTAYLDIRYQVKILDLLKSLNRELGITVIIVMHDLNLASEYCDRLVLLSEGRLYKVGMPIEVLTYEIIEEVYKTVVIVKENPLSKKPYVFWFRKI
jgi:iron complex transport system ATP-binding protein